MKATYQDINTFIGVAQAWLAVPGVENKFRYAVRKAVKYVTPFAEHYQEVIEDTRIAHCLTDKSKEREGAILRDANERMLFSPEGLTAIAKELRTLFRSEVEVRVFLSPPPSTLTDAQREAFMGFVIDPSLDVEPSEDEPQRHESAGLALVSDRTAEHGG